MSYHIKRLDIEELDLIQPLWEKLNQLHVDLSPDFKNRYIEMKWEKRKTRLFEKSDELMINTVRDDQDCIIGYCISSINKEDHKTGEIDSVYIEESHRNTGLGKQLINHAIDWLLKKGTTEQKLTVGVGNEKVLDFYKQFNFFPLHLVLQRIE